ncbi:hypothetical protein FNV43_RR26693 [Rhamnella rubrinervis]|uniref:Uncharacterized protein n=1 Tax=Rhamnella rubrinervis TaxID=2594499 RepID=A0A8K0DJ16_9ROSA|nr:hypothetical protein FNV43_RR26693 [Rhamnella rubrinervis]
MGRAEREQLGRTLGSHLNTIHETFYILDQTPPSSLQKVSWDEVVQMGDQVSKQATIVGMLWTGETPEVSELEKSMEAYFNMLQGLLLLSHGSTVGAGPTLSSTVHASVKQVVDCSFKLFKESVSLFEASNSDRKLAVPPLVGGVWEACSALKKTPSTNIIAIGRALTQVAVSIKDVLREMKELKPGSYDPTDEVSNQNSTKTESEPQGDDNASEDDLGNDLSPEEMKVAQSAISIVSETLVVIKELIRSITGLMKQEKPASGDFVNSLENLFKQCRAIGVQIDELGACLYPPQEVHAMKTALDKISSMIDEMQFELESVKGTSDTFLQSCGGLRGSLIQFKSELGCTGTADLEVKMHEVALNN